MSVNVCLAVENIVVDFTRTYQSIDNFGASDAWTFDPMIKKWMTEGRTAEINELADLLFSVESGIGLSAWRFNIGAGSKEQGAASQINLDELGKDYRRAELMQVNENAAINPNKQIGQIRFLKEAAKRGVKDLIAFSNSPPVWATKNGLAHPVDEHIGSTNLNPDKTQAFAQFLVNVVQYLKAEQGITINYISPINEPTWKWEGHFQEGNRYNMTEAKAVYTALYSKLADAGLKDSVAIEAGEVVEYSAALSDKHFQQFMNSGRALYNQGMNARDVGLYRNYIDEFLGDDGLKHKIGNKLSLHGYFSDHWSDRMGLLRELVLDNVTSVSSDAKIWMSEMCILGGIGDSRRFYGSGFDVNDLDYALHVGKMLHRDLSRMNASAWHWWLAVTPYDYKDGLLKINPDLEADSLQASKAMWAMGQFSRFIRPGYQRVELSNPDDLEGIMASAYKTPNDEQLVIVVINASKSSQQVDIQLKNLPSGKKLQNFSVYQTDHENNLTEQANVSSSKRLVIPERSIMTLVGKVDEFDPDAFIEAQENTQVAPDAVHHPVERHSGGGAGFIFLLGLVALVSAKYKI